MANQKILIPVLGTYKSTTGKVNKRSVLSYKVKLPKIITSVSTFEMMFGFKQPMSYYCGKGLGPDSVSAPGITSRIRL
jgi:hypothetical protein